MKILSVWIFVLCQCLPLAAQELLFDDKENYVHQGDELVVILKEQSSVGYEWKFDVSNPSVIFTDDPQGSSQQGTLGGQNIRIWKFTALRTGVSRLRFGYFHSSFNFPSQVKEFKIVVKPPKDQAGQVLAQEEPSTSSSLFASNAVARQSPLTYQQTQNKAKPQTQQLATQPARKARTSFQQFNQATQRVSMHKLNFLRLGQHFCVHLQNIKSSMGYRWVVKIDDHTIVGLENEKLFKRPELRAGIPDMFSWRFRVKNAGVSNLDFYLVSNGPDNKLYAIKKISYRIGAY